jgi:hypothetical protein
MEHRIEKNIGETPARLVQQVPMFIEHAVGRATGEGLEPGAVGGDQFDGAAAIGFRQPG